MNKCFPMLFSAGNIGNLVLSNRIIMAPMGSNFASATGEITDAMIAYYQERARGGAGLIMVENSNVDYSRGQSSATHVRIDDDIFLPGLHALVDAIHREGSKIGIQLNHVGGAGRKTFNGPFAPSSIKFAFTPDAPPPIELSIDDIEDIIYKFGQAARRARVAGFDMVQVHGGHIYLIAQFLCPTTNKRTDQYGGTLDKRMKFAVDVVKEVRSSVGTSFPIAFRLNGDSFLPDGLTLDDAKKIGQALERASINALDITCGGVGPVGSITFSSITEPASYAQGWRTYLAAEIKKVVSVPVVTVGVIRDPEIAEKILENGKADFIAIGRGLIADPEWPRKASAGNTRSIRKCISCNEGCLSFRMKGWRINCTVNVVAGRERELGALEPAPVPRRICIVGAGPAGMECARIAQQRGHHVSIYEKQKYCGGQLRFASVPPGKDKLNWLIDYLTFQLIATGVEVHTGSQLSAEQILAMDFDALVVATGARPIVPENLVAPGIDAITAHDVLSGSVKIMGEKVIVIGGGAVGCEVAAYLAQDNKQVTICEMLSNLAEDMLAHDRGDLIRVLQKAGVRICLDSTITSVDNNGVTFKAKDGNEHELHTTSIVLAVGVRPVNELAIQLENRIPEMHIIGDALHCGRIINAIYEGNMLGRRL